MLKKFCKHKGRNKKLWNIKKKGIMKRVNISVNRINFLSLEESPKLCFMVEAKNYNNIWYCSKCIEIIFKTIISLIKEGIRDRKRSKFLHVV